MFARLFKRSKAQPDRGSAASVPSGQRIYAIGDIHGELALALKLAEKIHADNAYRGPADTHLVFLGDFIDRGSDSRGVVEWLSAYAPAFATCHFLRGNHEDAFLSVLDGDETDLAGWRRFGGRETLLSYGISDKIVAMGGPLFRSELQDKVPPSHVAFLRALSDSIAFGDYLFVHAGIRPGIPLDRQDPQDLAWIRADFLESRADHGKVVVHGHTISEQVDVRANRIGIDTGAYSSGRLTALGLEGAERWLLQTCASDRITSLLP